VAQAAAQTSGKPDRDGWVRCTIPIESLEYGVRELMRLGADVEVLAPSALRTRMAQVAREITERHAARSMHARPARRAPHR
jgi:predicted DNA-binding transcriptional regulator YafY